MAVDNVEITIQTTPHLTSPWSGGGINSLPALLFQAIAVLSHVDVVKLGTILEHYFSRYRIGNALEIACDNFPRMGPGRIGMRKVRSPHIVIVAKYLVGGRTHRIVLKGRPDLAADIFTGPARDRIRHQPREFLVSVIEPVHEMRQPPDVALG